MKQINNQTILKIVLSLAIVLITLGMYMGFGFFFDVFAECSALFLLPIITLPLIWLKRVNVNKIAVSVSSALLIVLSIGAFIGVGMVSTSRLAYGEKPLNGTVETMKYSRSFMSDNYDIKQKVEVKVWLPDDYSSDREYPVMYVLDGDMLFDYTALKASEASEQGDDMIVVGIGYGYLNSTFARGGIIWQDTDHLRGRWRDFTFADDQEPGYIPGTIFGGDSKRGAEYTSFITDTLVKDIRAEYSIDKDNSTIFGHSLGGGLTAYFMTQYDPALGSENPFTNFVIDDNGYLQWYEKCMPTLASKMSANANTAHSTLNIYRIWGGDVNPAGDQEQFDTYNYITQQNWTNVNNYFWLPAGADHSDTQPLGIDNAIALTLGKPFEHQTSL